jgi:PAS domain S-box-containing protein
MTPPFWRRILQIGNPLPTAARVRRSVRAKLMRVVLVTTAIALCCAGAAMLTHDLSVYRHSWASDLSNEASILALSTAPALAFDDRQVAKKVLEALHNRPSVLAAALYSADGNLYASYSRMGNVAAPAGVPPLQGVVVSGDRVELTQPVVRGGEALGTIYLRAQYDVVDRVEAYLGIFAVVMLLSLAVAYAFSRQLQTVITEPLDAMTLVARKIVDRRDYALRAGKTTDDEIGLVVDAFNSMLDEVQSQTRALQQSNAALTEEIKVRQATEEALEVATARLESTMAAAEIGSWMWDVRTNQFTADRNLAALYGLDDENDLSGDPARHHRYIHADDLASVKAAENDAMTTGVLASTEFRVTLPDGSQRWMARRGKVQLDADGKAVFFSGLLIDISAQKEAEHALRASEKLYRAIGESIDYGVWVCAPGGRNIYASESFLRLTGITQKACSDFGWINLLHPDDAAGTIAAWRECIDSGGVWYREHRILGIDGLFHPILAQGVPVRGEGGEIAGWAGINLDISRLKQTEEALREADRRKDEFLATLAHELRNPLAPIRHAVRLLESESTDAQRQQWAREVIARQVRRMALLLDDLLDVSRITRGRLDLKVDVVNLDSLVNTAVETARPLIDAKSQHLTIRLPEQPIALAVDPLRLSQSLSNLLTNAAKYTDTEGSIILTVSVSSREIVFSVKDTGIGLEPKAIPGLFEMFSQVDSAIDRAEGGLGIGLALVKGLISLHGGRVEVASAGVGAGSEFSIRLPRSVVVDLASKVPVAAAAARAASGARKLILVADDNRDAAQSMAMVLEMGGYDVSVAHTGEEALQKARDMRPDAAILDIGMPDMTGYELARRLRLEPWGRGLVLMAITGWGQQEDKERARIAGFDRHLTKPVDPDDVERALHALLDDRHSGAGN